METTGFAGGDPRQFSLSAWSEACLLYTSICPDMKRTTLESLLAAMEGRGGEEIRLEEGLAAAARHSLENMLRYGG